MSQATAARQDEIEALSTLPKASPDLLVASMFINILSLAMPLALLQVYDRIVPNATTQTLALLVVGVLSALLLEALLRIGRAYATGWAGARFEHRMGNTAFGRLVGTDLMTVQRRGSGVLLEQMSALKSVKDYYGGQAATTLLDLPFVFIFLAVIWYLGGLLVLVPVVVLLVFGVIAVRTGIALRKAIEEHSTATDRKLNFIIEVLANIHAVKSMAMESLMMRRYERLQEGSATSSYEVAKRNAASIAQGMFFSQLTMVLVSSYGAILVMNNQLTLGQLAACTLLAGRSLQPLQRVAGLWTRFQSIQIGRGRVREILSMPMEHGTGLPPLDRVKGRLTLEGVCLRYNEGDSDILRGVDLDIAPGECIGIVGANASGKTTLLTLMTGILPPTEGRVLVDGQDLRGFDPASFHAQIGYLPQDGQLFKGTILENITMFNRSRRDAALRTADLLGLTDVVAALPMGFETVVGDSAYDVLPTGLRQRIAIARALLHNPPIILFDEANSAVDSVGDTYLRGALERLKGERTMVIISQRPSLLRMADRVYQLSMGTLAERVDDGRGPGGSGPGGSDPGGSGPGSAPGGPAPADAPAGQPLRRMI